MKTDYLTRISPGCVLCLKPERMAAYGLTALHVTFASLRYHGTRKTPWVVDPQGRCYRPSDFIGIVAS